MLDPAIDRMLQWTAQDDDWLLQHVAQVGCSAWEKAASHLRTCPAICAARWCALAANSGVTSSTRAKHNLWTLNELAVVLMAYQHSKSPGLPAAVSNTAICSAVSRVLPGRSGHAVKNIIKSRIVQDQQALPAQFRAAGLPRSIEGLLSTWLKDNPVAQLPDASAKTVALALLGPQLQQGAAAASVAANSEAAGGIADGVNTQEAAMNSIAEAARTAERQRFPSTVLPQQHLRLNAAVEESIDLDSTYGTSQQSGAAGVAARSPPAWRECPPQDLLLWDQQQQQQPQQVLQAQHHQHGQQEQQQVQPQMQSQYQHRRGYTELLSSIPAFAGFVNNRSPASAAETAVAAQGQNADQQELLLQQPVYGLAVMPAPLGVAAKAALPLPRQLPGAKQQHQQQQQGPLPGLRTAQHQQAQDEQFQQMAPGREHLGGISCKPQQPQWQRSTPVWGCQSPNPSSLASRPDTLRLQPGTLGPDTAWPAGVHSPDSLMARPMASEGEGAATWRPDLTSGLLRPGNTWRPNSYRPDSARLDSFRNNDGVMQAQQQRLQQLQSELQNMGSGSWSAAPGSSPGRDAAARVAKVPSGGGAAAAVDDGMGSDSMCAEAGVEAELSMSTNATLPAQQQPQQVFGWSGGSIAAAPQGLPGHSGGSHLSCSLVRSGTSDSCRRQPVAANRPSMGQAGVPSRQVQHLQQQLLDTLAELAAALAAAAPAQHGSESWNRSSTRAGTGHPQQQLQAQLKHQTDENPQRALDRQLPDPKAAKRVCTRDTSRPADQQDSAALRVAPGEAASAPPGWGHCLAVPGAAPHSSHTAHQRRGSPRASHREASDTTAAGAGATAAAAGPSLPAVEQQLQGLRHACDSWMQIGVPPPIGCWLHNMSPGMVPTMPGMQSMRSFRCAAAAAAAVRHVQLQQQQAQVDQWQSNPGQATPAAGAAVDHTANLDSSTGSTAQCAADQMVRLVHAWQMLCAEQEQPLQQLAQQQQVSPHWPLQQQQQQQQGPLQVQQALLGSSASGSASDSPGQQSAALHHQQQQHPGSQHAGCVAGWEAGLQAVTATDMQAAHGCGMPAAAAQAAALPGSEFGCTESELATFSQDYRQSYQQQQQVLAQAARLHSTGCGHAALPSAPAAVGSNSTALASVTWSAADHQQHQRQLVQQEVLRYHLHHHQQEQQQARQQQQVAAVASMAAATGNSAPAGSIADTRLMLPIMLDQAVEVSAVGPESSLQDLTASGRGAAAAAAPAPAATSLGSPASSAGPAAVVRSSSALGTYLFHTPSINTSAVAPDGAADAAAVCGLLPVPMAVDASWDSSENVDQLLDDILGDPPDDCFAKGSLQ